MADDADDAAIAHDLDALYVVSPDQPRDLTELGIIRHGDNRRRRRRDNPMPTAALP